MPVVKMSGTLGLCSSASGSTVRVAQVFPKQLLTCGDVLTAELPDFGGAPLR